MMKKAISLQDAVALVKDGMTIMVGGFLGNGGPNEIMDALAESGVKNLTVISNDTVFDNKGWGKLIVNHQVKKTVASYVGGNSAFNEQFISGEMECEFVPQGTLAERIRAKGCGLGGILTPTGVDTIVEEGKQKLNVDGKDYLLELPLRADIAFIGGTVVDESGNVFHRGTTKNFNPLMASAADVVVVEAEEIVPVGKIEPEMVHTPALFIDYIYKKQG
ncbi:MAG: CoA transferase subunit A [Bacteroidales bacterium]|nr:CoA transferase subunit A [Bacteroidales bacterium]